MTISRQPLPHSLFSTELECVTHLFRKRWPTGFICPFCNRRQAETAPAYTVVCRYCRKQTSITARTVMHGTRNSLLSWLLVAWQFSCRPGISAREIQRLLALSSYQTAWAWLHKLRLGAALAESAPCRGTVAFMVTPLALPNSSSGTTTGLAMEIPPASSQAKRIRFGLLGSVTPEKISPVIHELVLPDSTLYLAQTTDVARLLADYRCRPSSRMHHQEAKRIVDMAAAWLSSTYRRTVDSSYLQSYLDEFGFRYNTSSWSDKSLVYEYLLTGLLSGLPEHAPPTGERVKNQLGHSFAGEKR